MAQSVEAQSVELDESQAWITRRLQGLRPDDFKDGGVRFCATRRIVPPEQFKPFWDVIDNVTPEPNLEPMRTVEALVIFSNPFIDSELKSLTKLVVAVDGLRHDTPAMIWAPHTKVPEDRSEELCVNATRDKFVTRLMELGVDGILAGEPEGFQLAHMVGSKLQRSASVTKAVTEVVNERQRRAQYTHYLRDCIQSMLWDYVRVRMAATSIPAIDFNMPRGECPPLQGFTWGPLLGKGTFGVAYRIEPTTQGSPPQAIKVVNKDSVKDIKDLRMMKRMIDVMHTLSVPEWRHRNIVELYQVYHSPSHMLFRMEYGGPENLYRRLNQRQRANDPIPLPVEKVCSIIKQAADAIVFMHLGPNICHRDIKPENYILQETPDSISLKLADFDLAAVQEPTTRFRTSCGTVPFVAPEVFGDSEYNGMCADMWSLGIVLIEVHCDVCKVEEVTGLKRRMSHGGAPDEETIRLVKTGFRTKGSGAEAAEAHCRPELKAFLAAHVKRMIYHMVEVDTTIRWTASHLKTALADMESVQSPGADVADTAAAAGAASGS